MSYKVVITVTDCQNGKPIKGASISDGSTVVTTDSKGLANFPVDSSDDDPNPTDNIIIFSDKHGPQYATLNQYLGEVSYCLQPYPGPQPNPTYPPPNLPTLKPQPATLSESNRIVVSWTAPISYDKYLIWWTQNGQTMPQAEVDNAGSHGSWTASTIPRAFYTFAVDGGSAGFFGDYAYSGWGPTAITKAVANLTSLRSFLQASGINLPQNLRALMSSQTSVKKLMKLA